MRLDIALRVLCLGLLLAALCEAVALRKDQGIFAGGDEVVHDGDSVPTSSTTLIAQQSDFTSSASDSVLDRVGTITFGDDLESNNDNARQNIRAAPLTREDNSHGTALHRSSGSEPVRWGDPEAFNQRAIHRVAADIPDLIKKVDAAIPVYTRRVLTDYYDEPASLHPRGHASDDDSNMSLLEVEAAEVEEFDRFKSLDFQDRVKMLQQKKYDFENLRDSIQLELMATSKLQDRIRSSTHDAVANTRRAPASASHELKESEELVSLNPQLKEWADDARFSQNKREISSLLEKSSQFLDSFKHRLASDYNL